MVGNNRRKSAVKELGKGIRRGRFPEDTNMAQAVDRNVMIQRVGRNKAARRLFHSPFYAEDGGEIRFAKCGVAQHIWWNYCWGLHGRLLERI